VFEVVADELLELSIGQPGALPRVRRLRVVRQLNPERRIHAHDLILHDAQGLDEARQGALGAGVATDAVEAVQASLASYSSRRGGCWSTST